jgi:hypothetical protein
MFDNNTKKCKQAFANTYTLATNYTNKLNSHKQKSQHQGIFPRGTDFLF